jgi:hypothetical protein
VLALVAIALAVFMWPVRGSAIDRLTADSGIRATPAPRPFLAWYLTTGRRLRGLLGLASLFLPNLVLAALGARPDLWTQAPLSWRLVFACLAGTLVAELAPTRRPAPATRRPSCPASRRPTSAGCSGGARRSSG